MRTGTAAGFAPLVVMILSAGLAWAQPGFHGGCPGAGPGMGGCPGMGGGPGVGPGMPGMEEGPGDGPGVILRFLERLDLTDDQRDAVEEIMEETRERIEAIREESGLTEPGRDFLVLFSSPDLTAGDLADLAGRADALRERIREAGIEAVVRIHDVLTDEQLERIREFAERDFHGMRERFEGRWR